MKKTTIYILIFMLFLQGLMAQTGTKYSYIKPMVFQKRVTTLISDKSRSYYSLSNDKPSTINLRGPGTLKVLTRGRLNSDDTKKITYKILYTVDGTSKNSVKVSGVERSAKATYLVSSLGDPGQLESFEIELGRGSHTMEFYLEDMSTPVAARYRFTPSKEKKQKWIAFSPTLPPEPVDLITREKTVNYYRFFKEKPLIVEINGPTELRVLSRIENHYQMKGRIHYRLQVLEKNKVMNTYQLSSRRSEITVYSNNTELIPGKACEFVINVPKGRHRYEIMPLDKDKSTLLGRFMIPEKDVKLVD